MRPDRRKPARRALLGVMALLVAGMAPMPASAVSDSFVSIGTGAPDGVYYPIGRGLCRIVNRERAADGLRCSVEATAGSLYNARMLADRQLEFAILQGDVLFEAQSGAGPWAGNALDGLRSVMPLHPEITTLVVDATLAAARLQDLRGQQINAGHPGSGSRRSFDAMLAAFDLEPAAFARLSELRSSALPDALCDGRIVAFVEVLGHPSGLVRTVRQRCGAQLLPLTGPAIERMLAERPYLLRLAIPGDAYGLPQDVPSFGSHAVLTTRAEVGEDVVYLLTSRLLAAFEEVRGLHPTLGGLDAATLATTALGAPLHPGAARAYRELGLVP